MGFTASGAADSLKFTFGGVTTSKPDTWYLGLSANKIEKDGTGIKEPTIGVGGYTRVAIGNVSSNFNMIADFKIANTNELAFSQFTDNLSVTGQSGVVNATHWFLTTDSTSTDSTKVKCFGKFTHARPLIIDSVILIAAGDLVTEFINKEETTI